MLRAKTKIFLQSHIVVLLTIVMFFAKKLDKMDNGARYYIFLEVGKKLFY